MRRKKGYSKNGKKLGRPEYKHKISLAPRANRKYTKKAKKIKHYAFKATWKGKKAYAQKAQPEGFLPVFSVSLVDHCNRINQLERSIESLKKFFETDNAFASTQIAALKERIEILEYRQQTTLAPIEDDESVHV